MGVGVAGAAWWGLPPRTTARLWDALRRATWRHAVEHRSALHGHERRPCRRQTRWRENGPFCPAFRGGALIRKLRFLVAGHCH